MKNIIITNEMYIETIKNAITAEGYKVADTMNKLALELKVITLEQYSKAARLIAAAFLMQERG